MRKKLGVGARDVIGFVGFVCLESGLALVSVPAAWIVAGVLLLVVAVLPDLQRARGVGERTKP